MKRKYQGMISVALAAIVILLTGGYYRSGLWRTVQVESGPVHAPVADSWMPSEEQVQAMHHISGVLNLLAAPTARGVDPSPLALFGQRDAGTEKNTPGGRHGDPEKATYGLSLTLLAGPVRYCIVDGAFVVEGGRLEDGTAVMKIDNQRVLIAKDHELAWIYMNDDTRTPDRDTPSLSKQRKGQS